MKRQIGNTTQKVYPIGFGAMLLSHSSSPDDYAIRVIHEAVDQGINFIDTANVYGQNESLIAKALRERKSSNTILIATKGGLTASPNGWAVDASPLELRKACEQSLQNLKSDCIFLYQLHKPDSAVGIESSLNELAKLKKEGKILHIGLSNISAEQLKSALKITRIETVQNRCHVFYQRDIRSGFISLCSKYNITYIAYNPVGGAGRGHEFMAQHPLLKELSIKYQVSPYRICLSWLLHKGENILPIPGASRPESIRDSARASEIDLNTDDILRLDQIRGNA